MGLLRWPLRRSRDPYWDAFVNRPLADQANVITEAIRPRAGGTHLPRSQRVARAGPAGARPRPAGRVPGRERHRRDQERRPRSSSRAMTRLMRRRRNPPSWLRTTRSPSSAPYTPSTTPARRRAWPVSTSCTSRRRSTSASRRTSGNWATARRCGRWTRRLRPGRRASKPGRSEYVGDAVLTDLPLPLGRPCS